MSASVKARHAVRAAKNFNRWGARAATVYTSRRDVPISMFCMALGFEERRAKRAQQGGAA